MTDAQELVIKQVQVQIKANEDVDEDKIKNLVNLFRMINPLTDQEAEEVIAELQTRLAVKMDRGRCVKEKDHVSWYYAAKKDIDPKFWNRYSTYLYKDAGFNSDVINSIDSATDEMMDLLGNPQGKFGFQRRGLVIGDVQSGKTSTYIALMNKAADAKYRIIILLTGTIEKLRRQTQSRTDEGFVGLDSTAFTDKKTDVYVGVGNIDRSVSGWAVTSTTSDFNTSTGSKLSGKLKDINAPVLFVLKKNCKVLEQLASWLSLFSANPKTGKIDLPLLLIDDEADNASISTSGSDDPTTINKDIRKILNLFDKASYVGFTATPYANIFIDPDSTKEMLGDDLFPRHFIYALEPPTNYIGAASIFPKEGKYHYMIHPNPDCEEYVPIKHKKSYEPGALPKTLKEAIASFFIANAVRDLRGQQTKHRTMMINVSVYVDVQKRIAEQVETYVREMQRVIHNYYMMGEMALQYDAFEFIKETYDANYAKILKNTSPDIDWDKIQEALWDAVAPIVVRPVNGGNAAKNLNYDQNEENGLRLIAVGGYSLSRGLTLEGLCVSYFYRNTKMYDTLMQMGRWFGYRPKYEDLCQVWINDDAVDWYRYISECSDELKHEVRRMQEEQRTPEDFGLYVRSDNATLLITARNKMKTAVNYTFTVSLSGNSVETPFISSRTQVQENNLHATESFIDAIIKSGIKTTSGDDEYQLSDKTQYLNVPKDLIIDYLQGYQAHTANSHFHTSELVNMIQKDDGGSLDKWDVVIASGTAEKTITLGGITTNCVGRSFAIRDDIVAYQMSGSKSRLGNRQYAMGGLKKSVVKKIVDGAKAENLKLYGDADRPLNQDIFFKPDFYDEPRNPLIVIYPVALKNKDPEDIAKLMAEINTEVPLIGLSVGVPQIKGQEPKSYQAMINITMYRELAGLDEPDEMDDTIEE